MDNRDLYKKFCHTEKNIPIFLTYEWLNLVAKDNWNVALSIKDGNVVGCFPYTFKSKLGLKLIEHPPLTPYGGIWIKFPEGQKYTNQLSYQKDIIEELINQIPKFDLFIQKFYPDFQYSLPFYWEKFRLSTAYTYIIKDTKNPEDVFRNFSESLKQKIRKAEKELNVETSEEIAVLYNLNKKSYNEKGMKLPFSERYLNNILKFCKDNDCGELIVAKDQQGIVHAASLFIWDKNTIYYLCGASDPAFKKSSAMGLIIWEALKRSALKGKQFNFEGSMVEDIERFFRGFGGELTPYTVISKTESKILQVRSFIKEIIN